MGTPHYDTIEKRDFLERIAFADQEPIAWESEHSESGMYFYPQTIGGLKHMGQLHIFSEREFAVSASVNSRLLLRSFYRSIMTQLGSLKDNSATRLFQSNILECYIDDKRYKHIPFFRNNPKLANFIGPAIETVRKYFQDIYDSIIDEGESV